MRLNDDLNSKSEILNSKQILKKITNDKPLRVPIFKF